MKPKRSRLAVAFDEFTRGMKILDRRRFCDCELAGWWVYVESAQHHIRELLTDLQMIDVASAGHDQLIEDRRSVARQAYLGVLAVAQLLRHEQGMALTNPARLARGQAICERMLDALAPYVTVVERETRKLVTAGIDCLEIARSDAN